MDHGRRNDEGLRGRMCGPSIGGWCSEAKSRGRMDRGMMGRCRGVIECWEGSQTAMEA